MPVYAKLYIPCQTDSAPELNWRRCADFCERSEYRPLEELDPYRLALGYRPVCYFYVREWGGGEWW